MVCANFVSELPVYVLWHFSLSSVAKESLYYVHTVLFVFFPSMHIQSTLVISTSVISNNRLSRRENLIPVLT